MFTENHFNVLLCYYNYTNLTQREISKLTQYSLGKVNQIIHYLKENNLITDTGISKNGLNKLNEYRVDNAIIMAAGMSSRFAPLSYEKPKGLLNVKGEILIERQILQLKEKDINDIIIVVGYMKEHFFYLEEKYGVQIIVNDDYYKYNNTSTLIRVIDKLKNTYICSSDNYFTKNVFNRFEYKPFYSTLYSDEETNEWCVKTDNSDVITDVKIGGKNSWYMLGHVYFNQTFSDTFKTILISEYKKDTTKNMLWESVYINHIKELNLYKKEYKLDDIFEFDSLDELRKFDKNYINNTNSKILLNICSVFKCSEADITNIKTLKKGPSGIIFKFNYNNKDYTYRYPNPYSLEYANYANELKAMQIAKNIGIYDNLEYIDPKDFWMISKHSENYRSLEYNSISDVKKALSLIKKLHSCNMPLSNNFDLWYSTIDLISKLKKSCRLDFNTADELHQNMLLLNQYVQKDNFDKCICNYNFCNENLLFDSSENLSLTDWKYVGNGDPYNDLGTFIACSTYNEEQIDEIINIYHDGNVSPLQQRHAIACIALSAYHWFIWAIYQDSLGTPIGNNMYKWFKYSKHYCEKALQLYEGRED